MKLQRTNNITEYIKAYGVCSYEELCEQFQVSLSTIRRDVEELEQSGIIEKVHGGVKIADSFLQQEQSSTLYKFDYAKDRIAAQAARMVRDDDIILLGSGSTVAHMVRHLKKKKNITLITNNLAVLNETLDCDFNVISIGGNLDKVVMSFVGLQSARQISGLNANRCFLSCNGISLHSITNVGDLEADLKKTEIAISDQTILLADHRKFNTMSLYSFATLKDIDCLITDETPGKEYEELCQESSCRLVIAK